MRATLLEPEAAPATARIGTRLRAAGTIAIALGALTVLLRLPWVLPTPANWDAVQFSLAIDRFDLHHHQPHPPGYILYVALGRLANLVVNDPPVALALLSVAFGAAATALIYFLARQVFEDRAIALGAGLLLAASPLGIYYGSAALTYMPEMALSLVVAYAAWVVYTRGTIPAAISLGAALGISGGVRQTSLLVLLPLCAWALWGAGRRMWIGFAGALAVVCAGWLVPLLALSGGPAAYLREAAALADVVSENTSLPRAGVEGLLYNLEFEGLGMALGLGFAAVPLGLWASRVLRFSLSPGVRRFLLFWAVPPLALYAVSHVGQYGYMMVALPPLLMLSALCARILAERFAPGRLKASAGTLICAAISLASLGYFLLAQGPATAESIRDNDARWNSLRSALRTYDPAATVLVMGKDWEGPFRMAGYLLPAFHSYAAGKGQAGVYGWLYSAYGGQSTYSLPRPVASDYLQLPPRTHTVIALDEDTAQRLMAAHSLQRVTASGGITLYVIQSPGAPVSGLAVRDGQIRPVMGGDAGP